MKKSSASTLIRTLALRGARARLDELAEEMRQIHELLPQAMKQGWRASGAGQYVRSPATKARMSKAMKAIWIRRKAAKKAKR